MLRPYLGPSLFLKWASSKSPMGERPRPLCWRFASCRSRSCFRRLSKRLSSGVFGSAGSASAKGRAGWGSGEYMRLAVKNSRHVNQFDAVDIRQYRKMHSYWFHPGEPARVEMEYSLRGGPPFVAVSAAVVWVSYHFGLRPFFECPGCGRNCCLLYLAERCACRQCLRLSYPVQFETKQNQGFRRAWKARKKLVQPDGNSSCDDWIPDSRKPKGMHWATFNRLRNEAHQKARELWEGPIAETYRKLVARIEAKRGA